MTITENNKLEMTNVISYRGKATQPQMAKIMQELEQIIKENHARKNGPTVSATYAIENEEVQPIMDIEVLIPLDKEIRVPANYIFKPMFQLTNAVKIRHIGNPTMLQNSANELMKYIYEKQLKPVTAGYYVIVQEPGSQKDVERLVVDIYVGISNSDKF